MTTTLLQAVNASLKRGGIIKGDAGELTTFNDSARQHDIDITVQVWNEALHRLYANGVLAGEVAEGTITLVTGEREYDPPDGFEGMAGESVDTRVLVNATDSHRLYEYPGGYTHMFNAQPDPSDYTGQPSRWAINLTNLKFRMDTTPTDSESGDVYTFLYEKRISLSLVTDIFPVSDTVVDSLTPLVAAISKLARNGAVTEEQWAAKSFKDAVRLQRKAKSRSGYGLRPVG